MVYNAAGQGTQTSYNGVLETRTFNELGQLTRITAAGQTDIEYRFSATQNNGQITQMKNWMTGEEVTYQYDSLSRLASAVTTGPEWGLSFSYDGFGNKLAQTLTKGTGPQTSIAVDPANNRVVGHTYDANANTVAAPGLTGLAYDAFNHLTAANAETYS